MGREDEDKVVTYIDLIAKKYQFTTKQLKFMLNQHLERKTRNTQERTSQINVLISQANHPLSPFVFRKE